MSKSILFIQKTRADFYTEGAKNILSFPFPPEMVQDIEVVNKDAFEKQIVSLISDQKIPSSQLLIIFGQDMLFEKDFPDTLGETKTASMQTFIESVPFENTCTLTVPVAQGSKVVVANKDFYDIVKDIFEKQHFTVDGVTSATVLGIGAEGLTSETIGQIFKKFDSIKQTGFVMPVMQEREKEMFLPTEQKSDKKKTIVLAGVFVGLVLVLCILLFQKGYFGGGSTQQRSAIIMHIPSVIPTAPPVINTVASAGATAQLTMQILNESGVAGQADVVKNQLATLGFGNSIASSAAQTTEKTLVIFSQRVSPDSRNLLIATLQKTFADVGFQENSTASTDINITLGSLKTNTTNP